MGTKCFPNFLKTSDFQKTYKECPKNIENIDILFFLIDNRPKPEFYRRGFLKFDRLVLTSTVLVGSENWLVRLFYNRESIPNVVYFLEFFCARK